MISRLSLCYGTILLPVLSALSVTVAYCGQTAGWIRMPHGIEVDLGTDDIVSDGYLAPPQKGAKQPSPFFRPPCLLWPNQSQQLQSFCIFTYFSLLIYFLTLWEQTLSVFRPGVVSGEYLALVFERPFVLCYGTVVNAVSLSVTFVYCGQTVGWIEMLLGTEIRLGPGHIVLAGDRFDKRLYRVYSRLSKPVVQPGLTTGWTNSAVRSTRLSNRLYRFDNRLYRVYKHSTGWFDNRFDNRLDVFYTIQPVVKPVVQPVWQPVVSCKRGLSDLESVLFAAVLFSRRRLRLTYLAVWCSDKALGASTKSLCVGHAASTGDGQTSSIRLRVDKPPKLELELELDVSENASHTTDDIGEESWSLYIHPLLSLRWQSNFRLKPANEHPEIISSSKIFHSFTTLLLKENLAASSLHRYVTSHPSQPSFLPQRDGEMSTGQSAVLLCGWGEMADTAHSACGLNK